jgi:hypothetical protein
MDTEKGKTTNLLFSLLFFCWIRNPGWQKIRIPDKHLGSATHCQTPQKQEESDADLFVQLGEPGALGKLRVGAHHHACCQLVAYTHNKQFIKGPSRSYSQGPKLTPCRSSHQTTNQCCGSGSVCFWASRIRIH